MLTIEDLKRSINGGSFSNKYEVKIQIPDTLKQYYKVTDYDKRIDDFKILANQVSLPGAELSTPSVWVGGQEFKMRGKISFKQGLSITCYLDDAHFFRRTMDTWMRAMDTFNGPVVGTMFPSALGGTTGMALNLLSQFTGSGDSNIGYMANIEIKQLSGSGKATVTYKYYHTFPVSIPSLTYDSKEPSKLQSVTVDFAYAYYNCENLV